MTDIRIRLAKDKAELVEALKDGSDLNGPFRTYAIHANLVVSRVE